MTLTRWPQQPAKMKFRVRLEVNVTLNGVNPEKIKLHLDNILNHAYAEGLITGDTEAELTDMKWKHLEEYE